MKINIRSVAQSVAFYFAATVSMTNASSGVAQQVSHDSSAVPLPKNVVITKINVGAYPTELCITPNGDYLYVASSFTNNVSVISTSTNTVITTIPTGNYSFSAAVSPDGTRVYIGGYVTNSIWVISTATNTVTNTISLPSGAWPQRLALTPDGTQLYASDPAHGFLYIIDTSTLAVLTTISVPSYPGDICFTADGTSAYVLTYGGFVDQIDTASRTIVTTNIGLAKLRSPVAMTINPKSSRLFVANRFRTVVRVDVAAGTSTRFAVVPKEFPKRREFLGELALTLDGKFLYVINADQVVMVKTDHHQVIGPPIPMGDGAVPFDMVVAPNGNTLYVVNRNANNVAVVDISQ